MCHLFSISLGLSGHSLLSLESPTAGAFEVPDRVLSLYLLGEKKIQTTPTKQDLVVLFKISEEYPCPFYKGESPGS